MRLNNTTNFVASTAAALLVLLGMFAGPTASAAPIGDPTVLPGIAPAGYPNFRFNEAEMGFDDNVNNWFSNYILLTPTGNPNGDYWMFGVNQGAFTLEFAPGDSIAGSDGLLYLEAIFNSAGELQSGSLSIEGILPDLGINSVTQLVTADLVLNGFAFDGDLAGFSIDNIVCAPEIVGCTAVPESIYFDVFGGFPDIPGLNGATYRTSMSTRATVPLPASAWFMLSGLALLAGIQRRRKA